MIAIMIGLLINGYSVKSQTFIPATTQDEVIGGVVNTINTGNDFAFFDYINTYFSISVWDGKNPLIGWDKGNGPETPLSFAGSAIGTIEDPDVVLYPNGTKLYAFFIYIIKGDVWIEGKYYDGNTLTWNTSLNLLS
jgi:hypothetical protein